MTTPWIKGVAEIPKCQMDSSTQGEKAQAEVRPKAVLSCSSQPILELNKASSPPGPPIFTPFFIPVSTEIAKNPEIYYSISPAGLSRAVLGLVTTREGGGGGVTLAVDVFVKYKQVRNWIIDENTGFPLC